MLLRLAWRNVLRNRRRSGITAASIALGLAAMSFLWAYVEGMNQQMIENSTRYFAGDIQIHLKGYHDDPSLDLTIADGAPVLSAVTARPEVAAATVRLEGKALASQGDKSRGVILAGVDVATEPKVTKLFNAVMSGKPLAPGDNGVLVGEKMAQALGVNAGGELLLVGQAYDGSIASARVPVRGVFRTRIDELDGFVAVMSIESVRELLSAPQGASAVALRLKDREQVAAVVAGLGRELGDRYEAVPWRRLLPMVSIGSRYHEVMAYVVLAVFFGIVAAAVVNPVLMGVLERTREFGIVLAVGMSRSRLLGLVLVEAVLLGIAGLAIGNVLGLAVTGYFARTGIDMSAFGNAVRTMPGLEDVVYPVLRPDRSVMVSVVVFATAALTALYPAVKAALLEPVAAIKGRPANETRGHGGHAARSLPVFLLIAARNIFRNRRRTTITVTGTAFGIAAYVFLFGYFDGFGEGIIDNSTRYLTGHMQIERPGFRHDLAPELALGDAGAVVAAMKSQPGVEAAAPRVQAQALASSATRSEGIMLFGVDPIEERRLTLIHQSVVEGHALAPGADREVLIGRDLARKLGVRPGEKIVVMAQGSGGELGTAAFRVGGIFATESASFDGVMAFVTLRASQNLLAMGDRVSTVNVRLRDRGDLPAVLGRVRTTLPQDLGVAAWQDLLPQIDEMVKMTRVISNIILAIAFAVVAMAVMNTVFMAVAERTREFGVMLALGASPSAIQRMVVYETAVLMAISSVAGYAIGVGMTLYFGKAGIDLSSFFQGYATIPGLTGIVRPVLLADRVIIPGIILFTAGVLVSLYPARTAARLDPVRAIRHV